MGCLLGLHLALMRQLLLLSAFGPRGVVSFRLGELASSTTHVKRVRCNFVEEDSVVRDYHHGALLPRVRSGQLSGKPEDSTDREVVGRLIEKEEVWL